MEKPLLDREIPLLSRTPEEWAELALRDPLALLNDHAHLEKKAAATAQPPQFADIATRLDKLEKKAAVPAPPSPAGGESGPRLDKGEKKAAVPAASPALPLPPQTPKQSMLMARAEPAASNERARPDDGKPLLRDYSVEDVRFGIALVGSRHGSQQDPMGRG